MRECREYRNSGLDAFYGIYDIHDIHGIHGRTAPGVTNHDSAGIGAPCGALWSGLKIAYLGARNSRTLLSQSV